MHFDPRFPKKLFPPSQYFPWYSQNAWGAGLCWRMMIGGTHQQLLTPFYHWWHCVKWRNTSVPGQQWVWRQILSLVFQSWLSTFPSKTNWPSARMKLDSSHFSISITSWSVGCLHNLCADTPQSKRKSWPARTFPQLQFNCRKKQKLPPINTCKYAAASAGSESSCRLSRLCVNVITLKLNTL